MSVSLRAFSPLARVLSVFAVALFSSGLLFGQALPSTPPPLPPNLAPPAGFQPPSGPDDMPEILRALPDTGSISTFSYELVEGETNVYRITPTDGSEPFMVSRSMLSMQMNRPGGTDDAMAMKSLAEYPEIIESVSETTLARNYPGPGSANDPLETYTATAADGTRITIEQDPAAYPYARVTLEKADGETVTYSGSKNVLKPILSATQLGPDELARLLDSPPFILPEETRADFNRLSPEDWKRRVLETVDLPNNDIFMMARVYAQEKAKAGEETGAPAEESASPSPVETRATPEPTPETTPGVEKKAPPTPEAGTAWLSVLAVILAILLIAIVLGAYFRSRKAG